MIWPPEHRSRGGVERSGVGLEVGAVWEAGRGVLCPQPDCAFEWCGDRRTVVGREGTVFAGLEFGGFFGVPHTVSIRKSAGYGFRWNRIGNWGRSNESYAHPLQTLGWERQKPGNVDTGDAPSAALIKIMRRQRPAV